MDVGKIEVPETTDITILHPITGVETDMIITMFTTDSKRYNAVVHAEHNKMLRKRNRVLTAEQQDEKALRIIAKCTKSWKNVEDGGEELECVEAVCIALYTKHAWIFDQVNTGMADRSDFLSELPTS